MEFGPSHLQSFLSFQRKGEQGVADCQLEPKVQFEYLNPKDATMSRGSAIGFNKLVFDALCNAHANYWNLSSC